MKCLDNSYLDSKRIEDTSKMIDFYRNFVKKGDESDVFYERHLVVLETALKVLSDKLNSCGYTCTEEDWLRYWEEWGYYDRGADRDVIKFISDVRYHQGEENSETIHNLFSSGYCYHFALILQHCFKRGDVCLAYPFGHMVWRDINGVVYDIEGVNTKYEELVEVDKLGKSLNGFLHIPNLDEGVLDEDLSLTLTKLRLMSRSAEDDFLVKVKNVLKQYGDFTDEDVSKVIKMLPDLAKKDDSILNLSIEKAVKLIGI